MEKRRIRLRYAIHAVVGLLVSAVVIMAMSHMARVKVLAHGGSARISPDAKDDPGVRLKIVWMGAPYCPSSYDGTWIQRRLEQAFNIDIEPVFLGFGQKKELYFSGGDVPDMAWEGDPISVQRLAYHGFIAEISYELILRHAPDYVALMNREAPATWLYSYWDGRNWGLPTLWLDGARASLGAWRMDWLRRVGIDKVPETLEEFHTAMKKFVEEDPDGNGRRDTCGMMGQIEWWRCFNEFFGAFGIGAFSWTQRDGKAVWSGTLPEAKRALAVLRQWCAEGIIHPDFIMSAQGASEQKFLNGRTGYLDGGCYSVRSLDANDPMSLISRLRVLNGPKAEIVPAPLPIGPEGQRGAWCWGGGGNILVFGMPTVKDPARVVRLLKMLNELVTNEELFVESQVGKRGLHWDYVDQATGKASGIRMLPPYNLPHVAKREAIVNAGALGGGGFFSPNCGDPKIYNKYRTPEELEFVRRYKLAEYRIRDIFMKPDVVPSAGELLGDLRNFQETTYAEIMRGERDLDYFDRFVEEWNRRGGARLTREANELLAARNRIYKAIGVPTGQGM